MNTDRFQLKRQSDHLIYTFHRKELPDGKIGYQREDSDLWISFQPGFGWGAWDDEAFSAGRGMCRSPNKMPIIHLKVNG
ncbi:hypothetical protein [Rhizobium sp. CNPSo 4039]|uniref:hypothetical protein n=1 Tax=Rhizobium sp. CNPSo 4039 TaxID=3021409 RepID=UPI00254A6030|nr:hypothetical protein [Rhizobium sp. CNPSo 4039]MDK4713378.1 hypothetical protein [Rhizobium sp. CNPSo 4039]